MTINKLINESIKENSSHEHKVKKITDLLIIGSGPAGYTAGIYAARAARSPIILEGMQPGGQLTITTDVENYPGFTTITGPKLMEEMKKQAIHSGVEILQEYVTKVDLGNPNKDAYSGPFKVYTEDNCYETKALIIATGAQAKWLGIPSEEQFMGFGVSGCATCDGFFFRGKEVLVIGGGNTAVEEAIYLTKHATKVYIVHRRDQFRAEKVMQERLFKNEKISVIWNHTLDQVVGNTTPYKEVTGAILKNMITNEKQKIACSGIFIAIGHKPNTELFNGQLDLDKDGYILTAPDSTKTSRYGVYAAGDVKDKVYKQAVTAAGLGCMAAIDADHFLSEL